MSKVLKAALFAGLGFAAIGAQLSHGQQRAYVYPAQGQDQTQQARDEQECYSWARQQTGFDPSAPQYSGAPQEGGVIKGAAGGAIGGAVIGAIAGDAGKGAAIGAGVGAVGGGLRRERARDSNANAQQADIDNYNRAYHTCMQGRGYTIQ